jgi:exodeoxyribonuclease III
MTKYLIALTAAWWLLSCTPKQEQTGASAERLRLITYNVWYGFTISSERKTRWLEWMAGQEPDIVLLQELNEYTPEMLAADAAHWGHAHSELLKEGGFPTGITSRYPIGDVRRTLDDFHHGLMRARINDLYVYCIHLHPGNWEFRLREMDLLLQDIAALPPDAKVILAGDFNTFSPSDSGYYAHGRLEPFFDSLDVKHGGKNLNAGRLDYRALQRLEQAGFVDLEAKFRDGDYRFGGSFPTRIEKEGVHGDLRRLDYVYVSPNLVDRAAMARIIDDSTTQYLSDHLPVIAEFRLD